MKKTYSAPKLLLERFELKQRITGACTVYNGETAVIGKPSHADKTVCGWQIGEGMILWPSAPACTIPLSVDAESYGLCYNNPGDGAGGGVSIFAS